MSFSISLTDEEKSITESYTKLHSIEYESDIAVANEAYKEYVENGYKSRPISELWVELGLS